MSVASKVSVATGVFICVLLAASAYSWLVGWTNPPRPETSHAASEHKTKSAEVPEARLAPAADTASSSVDASTTQIDQANYLLVDRFTSKELARFVREAFSSTDPRRFAVAVRILDTCLNHVQHLGGIDLALPPTLNAQQISSAKSAQQQLRQRCSELRYIKLDDLIAKQKEWRSLLSSDKAFPNDLNITAIQGTPPSLTQASSARLREAIEAEGESSLFWLGESLREAIEINGTARKLPPESTLNHTGTLWAAIELARCRLAYPCGPESLRLLTFCSTMGMCADSLQNAVLSQLADDRERSLTLKQRDLILSALKGRRYSELGL